MRVTAPSVPPFPGPQVRAHSRARVRAGADREVRAPRFLKAELGTFLEADLETAVTPRCLLNGVRVERHPRLVPCLSLGSLTEPGASSGSVPSNRGAALDGVQPRHTGSSHRLSPHADWLLTPVATLNRTAGKLRLPQFFTRGWALSQGRGCALKADAVRPPHAGTRTCGLRT